MMDFWLIPISLMLIIVGLFPPIAGSIVLVERKVLADAVKLLLKEDIIPVRLRPRSLLLRPDYLHVHRLRRLRHGPVLRKIPHR